MKKERAFSWAKAITFVASLASGCGSETPGQSDSGTTTTTIEAPSILAVSAVDPDIVDPQGGSRLTITGLGLAAGPDHPAVSAVTIGGSAVTEITVISDTEIQVLTAPVPSGSGLDVIVERGDITATLAAAVTAWSPAELPNARLFDAAAGVVTEEPATLYEWQRLTAEIHPDWRGRDGNTLTWLPSTGRYWMVGGWNGYQEPDGFSSVPPDSVYPLQNTTDEVWSSADGVSWTLELPHGHGQFERRHAHNTVLWKEKLWMIGGDTHQGYYNHDVVSSADGISWKVELGPGAAKSPPWTQRALQMSGVYAGKLWTAGGQDLLGLPDEYVYHNDVWSTEDGVTWTQVAEDAPASETRWAGCGVLDGLVEFHGEMWLVGCARYRDDAVGTTMSNEVWSTTDGAVWKKHATPPWVGKSWPNVLVWDDKLWILFGYTFGDPANGWAPGNANEAWFSEDGETWRSLPIDAPVPGSHAQGVAVAGDHLLLAGGNYSFGFGNGWDKSSFRLVPFRGKAVRAWTDRGELSKQVTAEDDAARPVLVPDAFGAGRPGLQLDGSASELALDAPDELAGGESVFWVARAPYLPIPWGWEETFAPIGTLVGGPIDAGWMPRASIGLSGGRVTMLSLDDELGPNGESLWTRIEGGEGLQEGPGEVRMAGLTYADDGTVQVYVDGAAVGPTSTADHGKPRAWSRIGGSLTGDYYGPNARFAGTVGAVLIVPTALDPESVARIHTWARGRFGVP